MSDLLYLLAFVAVVLMAGMFWFVITLHKHEVAREKWLKAVEQRIYQLTPNEKPLFVFNTLQKTIAIALYDLFLDKNGEKMKIATSGGEKVLIDKTCSFAGDMEYVIDHFIERLIGLKPVSKNDSSCREYVLWIMAERRFFKYIEDIYVQLGTKYPPNVTQEGIDRLNTKCHIPNEIWEVLEERLMQSIKSRS